MNRVFERTENSTTRIVTTAEGLKEINHAMMEGKRDVHEMSHGSDRTCIAYKDGRTVTFKRTNAPEQVSDKPSEKHKNLQTHTGAVHAPGTYDKTLRVEKPRCCASRSALLRYHYVAPVTLPVTCKRCLAILAKEA